MKTFSQKVVELALTIPAGRVTTYGHIARRAGGGSMASRSVTGILAKAYLAGATTIPWHRIVYANGQIWLDNEHAAERMRLYKKEKIELDAKGKIKNFEERLWDFKGI